MKPAPLQELIGGGWKLDQRDAVPEDRSCLATRADRLSSLQHLAEDGIGALRKPMALFGAAP